MMTIKEVIALGQELDKEFHNITYVEQHYRYRGEERVRKVPQNSARYKELIKILASDEARVFRCEDCGEMCTWIELETWVCDFNKGYYICGCCYESAMGEDL